MTPDHSLHKEIKDYILEIWPDLPETFYGHFLYNKVRDRIAATRHRWVYPDSILRYVRELREEGAINYDVIRSKSLYFKTENNESLIKY